MGSTRSLKRSKDIISRPLPAHLYHSSESSQGTSSERHVPTEIPGRPMTSSSLSSTPKPIKYGNGKAAGIELVPQPSDDPVDPLNWPRWRKDLNLLSLLVMVGLVGVMKTAFVSTAGSLPDHYSVSHTAVAALTAAPLMISAVTGFISATAVKFWGKRPIYLMSAFILSVGTVWNTAAGNSYGSCLGSRMLQGFGWGAFDVLVNGSIQDTYFEHERNLPVTLYNILAISTTWGSPLLGGLVSQNTKSFTDQFRIMSCFYILALPLLVLAVPETNFDRSSAVLTPRPGMDAWYQWHLRRRLNKASILEYLKQMRPFSFKASISPSLALQAPRALIAPTTCLLFLLTLVPHGALWGLTTSVSLLTTPAPMSLGFCLAGVLMTGPWVVAVLCVGGFSFYRGLYERFTRRVSCLIIFTGSMLVLNGLLSYGLGVHNYMTEPSSPLDPIFSPMSSTQISLPLLSLQLGILAGGSYILDTITRPFVVRSASFTSPSVVVAQRSIIDMQSGITVLRSLAAGIFVVLMPSAVTVYGGLKAAVIGLATAQFILTAAIVALWWLYDESIWRADGLIMGLINLNLLKQSASFFETD